VKKRLEDIHQRIIAAAQRCGRAPATVKLVAVSKTVPADRVEDAIRAGVTVLGENYIQEARDKITVLSHLPVSWHFIGHLQSNKAKYAVRLFDLIHSVDSLKLACALDREANKIGKIQDILIQINIAEETTKSGVHPDDTMDLVKAVSGLENLSVKGLMTLPPFFDDPDKAQPYFKALGDLSRHIRKGAVPNVSMQELSMGMTGDFETAIECGATLVRIGTAIFGSRN
jgi:pyridoxal phosphate enzyme (YggS family)